MPEPQPHTTLTDDELLLRYQENREPIWLGYLLQRYTLLLLGVAMKYLKEKEMAEDAVQHVFYKALTHFPEGTVHNFKGWLYVLIRNHCLKELRTRNLKASEEHLTHLATAEDALEDVKWKDYTLTQLEAALEDLNEDQRKTLVLFYLQKKSYQQIMEQTGYSYMQVKSFIQNGKRNLKHILLNKLGIPKP